MASPPAGDILVDVFDSAHGQSDMPNARSMIWKHLVRKDFMKIPKEFRRGQNIDDYLQSVKEYCDAVGASDNDRLYIMVNNLEEDIKYELFAANHERTSEVQWIEDILRQMHKVKKTEVTPLLELMKMKQGENNSILEYASRLRVKAFQLMGHEDPLKREKFLIKAFIKGLCDRRLAAGIQIMDPETLAHAIEVAKREKGMHAKQEHRNEDDIIAMMTNDKIKDHRMNSMEKEVAMLHEKIDYLISIITNENRKRNDGSRNSPIDRPQAKTRKSDFLCFNCNMAGHLAKNCKRPCKICHKTNHTSYNCFKRNSRGKNYIRAFQDIEETDHFGEYETGTTASVGRNVESSEDVYCLNTLRENDCGTGGKEQESSVEGVKEESNEDVIATKRSYKDVVKSNTKKLNKVTGAEKEVRNWVQFINGEGNKPRKHFAATVITNRRPERAANKPIVKATLEEIPVKLFCDSGAECNTINLDLFKKIQNSCPALTVYEDRSKIKCASGALINCNGIVNLTLSLGGRQSVHPFKIIPGMFPELIAGIKLMKGMDIRVNPANDCIRVGTVKVPFISRVQAESLGEPQGNEAVPF